MTSNARIHCSIMTSIVIVKLRLTVIGKEWVFIEKHSSDVVDKNGFLLGKFNLTVHNQVTGTSWSFYISD